MLQFDCPSKEDYEDVKVRGERMDSWRKRGSKENEHG